MPLGSPGREPRNGHRFDFALDFDFDVTVGIDFDFAVHVTFALGVRIELALDFAFALGVGVQFSVLVTVGDVMSDLTVLFLTVNKMPSRWQRFHREHLFRATEGRPMVAISAKPLNWDRPETAYLIQDGPFCAWNVYKQILRGAALAETKYVAVAEDDTLYTRRHFSDFRPKDNEVAYDMSRWSVFSWLDNPFFSAIRKHGNFTMIGPTKLVIDALEEREEKYPQGRGNEYAGEIGRPDVERRLGVRPNKLVEWWCIEPMVNLCHPEGLSPTYVNTKGRERKPGELKAWGIPVWGKAWEITKIYNEGIAEDARLAATT